MNTLSRNQLIDTFSRGCKPASQWRMGTEHEKIGFCVDTHRPIPYEGKRSIRRVLEYLATDGWQLIFEGEHPIALKRGEASITLEPGGQLELSGAPLATIHEACAEVSEHLSLLHHASEALGIGFLGMGFQPQWAREDIAWMPKERYAVMRCYMPKVGDHGLDMMLRTATVQTNLDFSSEADMAQKMRIATCLQAVTTALFAASPFCDGKPSGHLSHRAYCWLDTDAARTGIPEIIFRDDFGFSSYVDWLLDVPMYFVMRDGHYVDCTGQSFRAFLAGKLPALPGEYPTLEDWELHTSTVFPDVRLKSFIEVRGTDAGVTPWICALPALWKGLLYDDTAREQVWDMIASWTHAEVMQMRQNVPALAFDTPFRNTSIHYLCEQMLDIAHDGLVRLNATNLAGEHEGIFLAPLMQAVSSGQTQAQIWLNAYKHEWQEDISPVFTAARFDQGVKEARNKP